MILVSLNFSNGSTGKILTPDLNLTRLFWYSWVSLGYFAVNLSGDQPKIY